MKELCHWYGTKNWTWKICISYLSTPYSMTLKVLSEMKFILRFNINIRFCYKIHFMYAYHDKSYGKLWILIIICMYRHIFSNIQLYFQWRDDMIIWKNLRISAPQVYIHTYIISNSTERVNDLYFRANNFKSFQLSSNSYLVFAVKQ